MASLAKTLKLEAGVIFFGVHTSGHWQFVINTMDNSWKQAMDDPVGAVCTYIQEQINERFYDGIFVPVGPEQCYYKFDASQDRRAVSLEYHRQLRVLRREVMTQDDLDNISNDILTSKEFPRDSLWASKDADFYWAAQDLLSQVLGKIKEMQRRGSRCQGVEEPGAVERGEDNAGQLSESEASGLFPLDWAKELELGEASGVMPDDEPVEPPPREEQEPTVQPQENIVDNNGPQPIERPQSPSTSAKPPKEIRMKKKKSQKQGGGPRLEKNKAEPLEEVLVQPETAHSRQSKEPPPEAPAEAAPPLQQRDDQTLNLANIQLVQDENGVWRF